MENVGQRHTSAGFPLVRNATSVTLCQPPSPRCLSRGDPRSHVTETTPRWQDWRKDLLSLSLMVCFFHYLISRKQFYVSIMFDPLKTCWRDYLGTPGLPPGWDGWGGGPDQTEGGLRLLPNDQILKQPCVCPELLQLCTQQIPLQRLDVAPPPRLGFWG